MRRAASGVPGQGSGSNRQVARGQSEREWEGASREGKWVAYASIRAGRTQTAAGV